jgi:hypothetical protein
MGLRLLPGPCDDACHVHRAGLTRDFLPILEEGQCGNAADVVCRCEIARFLGVDLGDAEIGLESLRGLFIRWRHGAAGTAPGRPEIDQHRDVVARDVLREPDAVHVDRLCNEEIVRASAAGRMFRETVGRQSVDRIAMRTDDMQGIGHGISFLI